MNIYTIEITSMIPYYRHVTVQARDVEEAIELAFMDAGGEQKLDWEGGEPDEVTGIWEGAIAYSGEVIPIPEPAPKAALLSIAMIFLGGVLGGASILLVFPNLRLY